MNEKDRELIIVKVGKQIRAACKTIDQKAAQIADTCGEFGRELEIRISIDPKSPAAEIEYNLIKLGIPEPDPLPEWLQEQMKEKET